LWQEWSGLTPGTCASILTLRAEGDFSSFAGCRKKASVMLSAAKHLLFLIENKPSRSFAALRMTSA
jgi:hypothetical protein